MFSAVPKVVLKTGSFNNVTVIRGFNSDESATRAYAIGVYSRARARARVCVCERERERERVCVCVCVCV